MFEGLDVKFWLCAYLEGQIDSCLSRASLVFCMSLELGSDKWDELRAGHFCALLVLYVTWQGVRGCVGCREYKDCVIMRGLVG